MRFYRPCRCQRRLASRSGFRPSSAHEHRKFSQQDATILKIKKKEFLKFKQFITFSFMYKTLRWAIHSLKIICNSKSTMRQKENLKIIQYVQIWFLPGAWSLASSTKTLTTVWELFRGWPWSTASTNNSYSLFSSRSKSSDVDIWP